LVIVPVEALVSLAVDNGFRDPDVAWAAGLIGRAPVAILLYSAIVGFGLAAVHHRRAEEARGQARRLETALAAAREASARAEPPRRLMVMTGSRRTSVELAEVEWFASAGNYVVVHWSDREGLLRETMRALEARLDPAVFARSHRSTLVNLAQVRDAQSLSDGSWRLTTRSGAELVASRTYRDALLARLGRQASSVS
jgi:DNA-binding LytR/AlgR family response regulator